MKIAIVGAESTGKSSLAAGLAGHLQAQDRRVHLVDEVLREWCLAHQRTPRADEQLAIATEQARRADTAGGASIVIADTTPLMIAVYSDMLFNDRSLYPFALAHQQSYDLTLLTALDLPWVADGLQRDGPHVREPVDALVRAALRSAGLGFAVVSGLGGQRLANALSHIRPVT
jgi:nicotinamide riboside kinase